MKHILLNAMVLIALCSIVLLDCSSETRITGGTETENTKVAGVVYQKGKKAPAGVMVALRNKKFISEGTHDTVTYSTVTDIDGTYAFTDIPTGRWVVEFSHGDSLGTVTDIQIANTGDSVALTDTLQPTRSLIGSIENYQDVGTVTVFAYGLDRTALADADGIFSFENMPAGNIVVKIVPDSQQYSPLERACSNDTDISELVIKKIPSVLLENFDDGDQYHLYSHVLKGAQWYVGVSDKENAFIDPSTIFTNFTTCLTDSEALGTFSLHARITVESGGAMISIPIGLGLGYEDSSNVWFDFTSVDSICFMAHGQGTVHVIFVTRLIIQEYSPAQHFETTVTFTPSWQKYTIPMQELLPAPGLNAANDGRKWSEARDAVSDITFYTSENLDLWLDNIELIGISPSELWK